MNIPDHWNDGIARMTTAEVNAYARQLQTENSQLRAALTRAEAERDEAVKLARAVLDETYMGHYLSEETTAALTEWLERAQPHGPSTPPAPGGTTDE